MPIKAIRKRLFDSDFKKKEPEKKPTEKTTLKQRETIDKHFCVWADKNGIARSRENFMAFLEINEMVDSEKAKDYLSKTTGGIC